MVHEFRGEMGLKFNQDVGWWIFFTCNQWHNPLGMQLGLVLFDMYTCNFSRSVRCIRFNVHFFVDNYQLNLSNVLSLVTEAVVRMNADLEENSYWSVRDCLILSCPNEPHVVLDVLTVRGMSTVLGTSAMRYVWHRKQNLGNFFLPKSLMKW